MFVYETRDIILSQTISLVRPSNYSMIKIVNIFFNSILHNSYRKLEIFLIIIISQTKNQNIPYFQNNKKCTGTNPTSFQTQNTSFTTKKKHHTIPKTLTSLRKTLRREEAMLTWSMAQQKCLINFSKIQSTYPAANCHDRISPSLSFSIRAKRWGIVREVVGRPWTFDISYSSTAENVRSL